MSAIVSTIGYIFVQVQVFSTEVTTPELPSNNVLSYHEDYHVNISPKECKRKLKAVIVILEMYISSP